MDTVVGRGPTAAGRTAASIMHMQRIFLRAYSGGRL